MSSFRTEDEHPEREQLYDVTDECAVTLHATSGDLAVMGWDQLQLGVTSEKPAAVAQEGNRVVIQAPRGSLGDVRLRVPRHCDLTVQVSSGDMVLKDFSGKVSLQTISGDLHITNLQGELEVRTASGDLVCRSCRLSKLSVDSASGDMTVESPLEEGGSYHIRKASGDLRLLLPEDQRCTLRQQSISGDITCKLPHEKRWIERHTCEILVNGGGVPFTVGSASGDVWIGPAGSIPEPQAGHRPAGQPRPMVPEPPVPPMPRPTPMPMPQPMPMPPVPPVPPVEPVPAGPFGLDEPLPAPVEDEAQDPDEEATVDAQRMAILKAIQEGRMSVNEGLKALEELGE